jgi:hypothetical protein
LQKAQIMVKTKIGFIISAVFLLAMTRLLPHPWNFTPLVAITLFSGSYLPKPWMGLALAVGAMFISDLLINMSIQSGFSGGYWSSTTPVGVYLGILVIWMAGSYLRGRTSVSSVLLATLFSSVVFYIISNSLVWVGNPNYAQSLSGWAVCLLAGVPFIQNEWGLALGSFFFNQIIGDLFYSGVLYGSFYLINQRSLKLNLA